MNRRGSSIIRYILIYLSIQFWHKSVLLFIISPTIQVSNDSLMAAMSHDSADLNNNNDDNRNMAGGHKEENNGGGDMADSDAEGIVNWQSARSKSEILAHPLYEQLLSAHVACLRIATPVDQLPRIDAQLQQSQHVVAKYSALGHVDPGDDKELDQFMVYILFLFFSFYSAFTYMFLLPKFFIYFICV